MINLEVKGWAHCRWMGVSSTRVSSPLTPSALPGLSDSASPIAESYPTTVDPMVQIELTGSSFPRLLGEIWNRCNFASFTPWGRTPSIVVALDLSGPNLAEVCLDVRLYRLV